MKGGCVAGLPVLCVVSPFCFRGGPVEWRGGLCVVPRVRVGYGTLTLFCPSHIVLLPLSAVCCGRGSAVVCGIAAVLLLPCRVVQHCRVVAVCVVSCERLYSFLLLSLSCVLCHSIVGLVLCLCDRVASLWNSGDGLCWVEGRVVCVCGDDSV